MSRRGSTPRGIAADPDDGYHVLNGFPTPPQLDQGFEVCKPSTRTPRPKEEYITTSGSPHEAFFVLSDDLESLSWTSKRAKGTGRKELYLREVEAIEAGQGTEVFKRFPQHAQHKHLSFSLLYKKRGKPRSLDISCRNSDDYELWFTGLNFVHLVVKEGAPKVTSPPVQMKTNPLSDLEPYEDGTKASQSRASATNVGQAKDLIGDVYIWGAPSGAIGTGRNAHNNSSAEGLQESWVPALVHDTFRLDVAAVACGPRHAAVITRNGEAYTWGCGDAGRLGHGDCQSSAQPKMVMDLSGKGVVQVACGDWHTSAVTREGCLYTWGDGTAGILGHGTPHRQWAPKRVERPLEGVTITLVTSGPYHTAAVASNGSLYTWGDGFGGKLGHGGHDTCLVPRKVEPFADWRVTHAAAGVWHTSCVAIAREGTPQNEPRPQSALPSGDAPAGDSKDLKGKGDAMCRLRGGSGDLGAHAASCGLGVAAIRGVWGHGDEDGRMVPERVARGPESVKQVAAGLHFTLLLSAGGKVWQTGSTCASGFDGRALPPWEGTSVPVRVKGALGGLITTQISAGMHHVAVIAGLPSSTASHMFTWGRGTEGQLGHGAAPPGTSPNCPEPVLLRQLEGRNFLQVACGGCNTMAVVEHDASLVLRDYEGVRKELDELTRKHPAPPAGLLVGSSAGFPRSPSEGGLTARPSVDGRRSRHGSLVGEMAQSLASSLSISRASKAGSDGGGSAVGKNRASHHAWAAGPSSLPPSAAHGGSPAVFTCPITMEVFEDPVVAADGYTYERSAIIKWLRTSSKSPMTNMPMDHLSLTPSHAVRSAIAEWKEFKALRDGTPVGGRHRYAHSFGGSSQGSLSSYVLRAACQPASAPTQIGEEGSGRGAPHSSLMPHQEGARALGSRL
eukprot:CAMPEP_0177791378 /NCGR_PEP_ID=MMETSP0491_2-20121128/23891_1 /TAXON_ID=63592 /ORGANISM="Tetraselmis chuii, Strain PLY429" /LENGTH=898 /DNA_ID=CAMNT_0019313585 /DNA_START=155 /DNA_END=2853 /DNA_ORIENTATION=+